MVFTRVAADADQDTLLESLRAVDENRAVYGISGVAQLLSGFVFFIAAWFLLRTWIIRDRWASPLVPYLFALSAVCTVLSGACALLIASYSAPEINFPNGSPTGEIAQVVEVVSGLRWITGKIGFVAAGLAVIVAAWYQWQVGGTLRWVAPSSLINGRGVFTSGNGQRDTYVRCPWARSLGQGGKGAYGRNRRDPTRRHHSHPPRLPGPDRRSRNA